MKNSSELKLKKYIVASVDILGGKELISKGDSELQKAHEIFSKAIIEAKKWSQFNDVNIEFKIFSDNIIIALEPKNVFFRQDISKVMSFVALLQWNFC